MVTWKVIKQSIHQMWIGSSRADTSIINLPAFESEAPALVYGSFAVFM